jgi:hypothetical protein
MYGERDVYDVVARCFFRVQYTSTRVAIP